MARKPKDEIPVFGPDDVEEFIELCDSYFDECDNDHRLYGEAGLCLYLSEYNRARRTVSTRMLHEWYDGKKCEYLQDAVLKAYLRIQAQIEADPRYREKGGMATRAIFLQKQPRLGDYTDKEKPAATAVNITFGGNMDDSDFK